MSRLNPLVACITGIALTAAAVSSVHADLIAADSFLVGSNAAAGEYAAAALAAGTGAEEAGQNPLVPGFTGEWLKNPSQSSSWIAADAVGLGYPATAYQTGGGIVYAEAFNANRIVSRELAPFTPASTYYMSGLVRPGATDDGADGRAYMGFGSKIAPSQIASDAVNIYGMHWGVQGNADTGGVDLVIRHRTGANAMANEVVLAGAQAGADYLFMLRMDHNVNGGQDRLTYWINPTDLSSEAAATATALVAGELASFGLNVITDIKYLNFAGSSYNGGEVRFDEARLATTFEALAGPPVPEPAAGLVLAAMGGVLLSRRGTR